MDAFLDFLTNVEDTTTVFSAADIIIVIVLCFLTSTIIGYTYQATYVGTSYAQTYVQTLVILTMVVGIIMLVIGSNIARAFSLVGALSVVRFRNAVKDTRDVGYVFYSMAIGMAVGTRFYALALVATASISFVIWFMFRTNMFANRSRSNILRIRMEPDLSPEIALEDAFSRYLRRYNLIATESVQGGFLIEHVFEVDLKNEQDSVDFLNQLRQITNNNKVVIVRGYHEVNL
jgi:uncharacterized membrane protein YhiD involved in acid resistance